MSFPEIRILPAVGSIKRVTVRPTVVLPQPDSPTRPSVSPGLIVKLTPSTANTVPLARWSRPLRIGKCFLRSRTSSTALWSDIRVPVEFARAPAGGPMTRQIFFERRIFRAAAILRVRAPWCEHAASRQMVQPRDCPRDFLQSLEAGRDLATHRRQSGD